LLLLPLVELPKPISLPPVVVVVENHASAENVFGAACRFSVEA